MRQETYTLSQKELQRVSVISACIKGGMACARAAALLCLSVRQIKRLKKRMREDGEAALAHANRGRPSHRRLPDAVRERIVQLSRSTYAGFNDHHLCEKLVEREGFSLSRETLRRLLRNNGLRSPRKRRAPAHRQRRVRSARLGELVQLDGSPHDWLEGRGPQLTALGMQDDATGKILAARFFPSETTFGYLCLLRQLLRRFGVPLAFYGDHSGIFVRNDDHWTVEEQLAGKRQPTQFGRALEQLSATFIAANSPQAKGRVERLWGVLLRKSSIVSAAWCTSAWLVTTTSCNGKADASRFPSRHAGSASLAPKYRSIRPSMGASRSTMATPAWNIQRSLGGDSFTWPLR